MKVQKPLTIGIDATNLLRGGGVTHLVELLRFAQPKLHCFDHIIVWGNTSTLQLLGDQNWLIKITPPALNRGLYHRTRWKLLCLPQAARDAGCDVLLVPGGSYVGDFHPVVNMSRNLLPFEMAELLRYGWTFMTIKLMLLRLIQSVSFKNADGVIFLTQYAHDAVLRITGKLHGHQRIIPHGLNSRFIKSPKAQHFIDEFDHSHPYRVLYVSIIDQYKHQWHVVEAIAALRNQGLPIVLDLVGPAYPAALKRLDQSIARLDADRQWVYYHGSINHSNIHTYYADANLGLFASSCENMPNILLETMASGLPIACSNRGPMPEILGKGAVYFNPENSLDIARALREIIESSELRTKLSQMSSQLSRNYSWSRCAEDTFKFLTEVAVRNKAQTMLNE